MRSIYLRLSVTDHCNFRCAYCRPRTERAGDPAESGLSLTELHTLVREVDAVAPIRKLRITGGEPLVRSGVSALVRGLRTLLPEAELCLTTNGSLLARQAQVLRAAGLDRLNISIDSLDAERFAALTDGAALAPVLDGIRAARDAGFDRLRLNTVLVRSVNGDALPDLLRAAAAAHSELRFIELMPFAAAGGLPPDEFLSADEALAVLCGAFPYVADAPGSDTARRHVLWVDGRPVTVGFIAPVSHPFCGGCDRLRLDARGRLFACLRRAVGLDLGGLFREGRLDELRACVRSVVAPKAPPRSDWPERDMSTIGG
jgi:cyclic pyranopterin phosphate synthase